MPIWLIQVIVAVGLSILGYLLMPKPKQPTPPSLKDLQEPTFQSGREMPKVVGTLTVKGLNGIYFGDKALRTRKVDV